MWKKMTKTKAVLSHLQEYGSITSWEAIKEYGATRLSAIIYELRHKGYPIATTTICDKDRYGSTVAYAKYTLEEDKR